MSVVGLLVIKPMSQMGPKTEVAALRRDVCFAPVSGHRQAISACPKSANNGLMHRNKPGVIRSPHRREGETTPGS
jgi:hypothetical protein